MDNSGSFQEANINKTDNSTSLVDNSTSLMNNSMNYNKPTLANTIAPNYILAGLYWFIFASGIVGNLIFISVNMWRNSSKQAATQYFLVSLSMSDLGLLLGPTWIAALASANPAFYIGRVFCKLNNLWSMMVADGSVVILSVIAIDRWQYGSVFVNLATH